MEHKWTNSKKGDMDFCENCGLSLSDVQITKFACVSDEEIQNLSSWLDGDYTWQNDMKDLAFRIVKGRKEGDRSSNAYIMSKIAIVVMVREKKLKETLARDIVPYIAVVEKTMDSIIPIANKSRDWRKVNKVELEKLKESFEELMKANTELLTKWDKEPPLPKEI